MNKNKKNKIFNRHFIGMVSIFAIVVITVLTFVTFIEDALKHDKDILGNKKVLKK